MKKIDKRSVKKGQGINFAYEGTGVFNTMVNQPNMTSQIQFFQQLLSDEKEEKLYTKQDLNSSIALVSIAGNDYATYMAFNGTIQGIPAFTRSLIKQLVLNLKRIHKMGVKRIGITSMGPLGCLPKFTSHSSYQNCSQSVNSLAEYHNKLLKQSLQQLNKQTSKPVFVILDLYTAFIPSLNKQQNPSGSLEFDNPLEPCCVGQSEEFFCGSVDETNGMEKYRVCKNPNKSFFWDVIHPSQQGWDAVYSVLKPSLHKLF